MGYGHSKLLACAYLYTHSETQHAYTCVVIKSYTKYTCQFMLTSHWFLWFLVLDSLYWLHLLVYDGLCRDVAMFKSWWWWWRPWWWSLLLVLWWSLIRWWCDDWNDLITTGYISSTNWEMKPAPTYQAGWLWNTLFPAGIFNCTVSFSPLWLGLGWRIKLPPALKFGDLKEPHFVRWLGVLMN